MNPFRQLLDKRSDRVPVGTWIMSASGLVAEALGCAGFDWAVLDMEHSPLDLGSVVQLLQAIAGTPMVPVLRVPWNEAVSIKRVLDAGAQTLLVPFVQDADEAARAVAAARYPPQGIRGMAGMSRGSRFGTAPDHFASANHSVSVIVQIETPQAVEQAQAIASVAGVDALFLGPSDLSGAMGLAGQPGHPAVREAMASAVRAGHAAGKPVGTVGGSLEAVAQYRALGCDFVAIASDLALLMGAAKAAVTALSALPASTDRTN